MAYLVGLALVGLLAFLAGGVLCFDLLRRSGHLAPHSSTVVQRVIETMLDEHR